MRESVSGIIATSKLSSDSPATVNETPLSAIARDLAEGRPCRMRWAGHRSHAAVGVVVKELFDARYTKDRALTWSIDAESLGPFLAELSEHGLEPAGRTLREPRQP